MDKQSSSSKILVTYRLKGAHSSDIIERTLELPSSLPAEQIVPEIKAQIRPLRSPDPSDNYRGQSPDEVQIVNIVNLSALL